MLTFWNVKFSQGKLEGQWIALATLYRDVPVMLTQWMSLIFRREVSHPEEPYMHFTLRVLASMSLLYFLLFTFFPLPRHRPKGRPQIG
jgi:hypothetical protein